MHTTAIKYTGTALPADSDTETLYDTTDDGASGVLQYSGVEWFNYRIDHSHKGTIKAYFSDDGGASWAQYDSHALAPNHSSKMNFGSFRVTGGRDFKAEWVNGGTTQTTFTPFLTLSCDQDEASSWPVRIEDYVSGGNVDSTQNFDWIPVGPSRHVSMLIAVTSGSSPNGTWKLEFTKDGGTTTQEVGSSSGEFTDLTGSNETFDANWYNLPGDFVRLVYTSSSGSGTLNVQATSE